MHHCVQQAGFGADLCVPSLVMGLFATTRCDPVRRGGWEWGWGQGMVRGSAPLACRPRRYFDNGNVFTLYRGSPHFDGGLSNFIPLPPAQRGVRVSCFPGQQMRAFRGIAISPDTFEAWPHDFSTMLRWAFEPAPDEMLLQLIEKGRRDARAWALQQGIPAAVTSGGLVLPAGAVGAGAAREGVVI